MEDRDDKRIILMRDAKPARAVLSMSIPVIIGMFIMIFYNLVDTFFIGLLNDDYQLAASNLAYPVMMICIAVSSMVGTGGASYIARSLGAGKPERAEHTLTLGIIIVLCGSIVISVLGLIFSNPLIRLLGASNETFLFTKQYVCILLLGSFFIMGSFVLGQLLRSEGSTVLSVVGMMAGTVANIILDPIMILYLGWGISGAAFATVLGNVLSVLIFSYFYFSKKTLLRPSIKYIKFDADIIKEIFWVGIPATLEQLLVSAAYVINNNLASAYGDSTLAATGISSKIMTFGNYIYQGFSAGCQPLMGYNYGAKNYLRMKKLIKAGMGITCGIEIFIMIILGIFAPYFVMIFSRSEHVILIGTQVIRASMLCLPFIGATAISRSTFQAMGKPQNALIITIFRQIILYIPLLFILNHFLGFSGLIHAQPLTEAVIMFFAVSFLWKTIKGIEIKSETIKSKQINKKYY
ncbi:MAG: MATE family efflux transporter [Clostridium sp.]|nr:MATE family efflux transporter [Clostridium sp.]